VDWILHHANSLSVL